MSVTNYFQRIIQKQNEIGYDYAHFLNRPATLEEVENAERELGFQFNDELKELYSFATGLNVDLGQPMPTGKVSLIPLLWFANLQMAVRDSKDNWGFAEEMLSLNLGYSPEGKMLLFLYDGAHTQYWVDLNSSTRDYGKIWLVQGYGDPCGLAFQSLEAMFQTICHCYESNIFSVTREGYLESNGQDYEMLYRIIH